MKIKFFLFLFCIQTTALFAIQDIQSNITSKTTSDSKTPANFYHTRPKKDVKLNASTAQSAQNEKKSENKVASSADKKIALRTIQITNNINDQMATYTKHWSGNHTPEWKLLAKNQTLNSGASTPIEIDNNKLELEFMFDFKVLGKSYQKGSALATFEIPPGITNVDIEFSWDKPERLVLINKTPDAPAQSSPLLLAYNEKK